jgi:hypothetical protein
MDCLNRYEYLLWRQARQLVFTLELLQRRKRAPSRSLLAFPSGQVDIDEVHFTHRVVSRTSVIPGGTSVESEPRISIHRPGIWIPGPFTSRSAPRRTPPKTPITSVDAVYHFERPLAKFWCRDGFQIERRLQLASLD